jgi:uncharacterized protein YcbK (DUF882 family)
MNEEIEEIELSDNFFEYEFACKGIGCCHGSAPVDKVLIEGIEQFRELLWKVMGKETPVKINSGFRCKRHNKDEGANDDSYHTKAMAADVSTAAPISIMYECALQVPAFKNGGIGFYKNRLHLDTGPMRRWEDFSE